LSVKHMRHYLFIIIFIALLIGSLTIFSLTPLHRELESFDVIIYRDSFGIPHIVGENESVFTRNPLAFGSMTFTFLLL